MNEIESIKGAATPFGAQQAAFMKNKGDWKRHRPYDRVKQQEENERAKARR